MTDKAAFQILKNETERQTNQIQLIASENIVSNDVLEAVGSIFTNKYAEGYPGKRYYGGCENADAAEQLAIDRITKLFGCKFANVQPHSGTQANLAAYNALIEPGDKIMGMSLPEGGHLTHGHSASVISKLYNVVQYGVNNETHLLNFDEIRQIALKEKPKLIICGASSYSRKIEWSEFRKIADEVGAWLMADVAHIAGQIVTGEHMNPFPHAHIVTSTSHKTLRSARGGIILTNDEELINKINSSVFPQTQGGPLMNNILGKAVGFGEALQPSFKEYIIKVNSNSLIMSNYFIDNGHSVVTNGTDIHYFTLNTKKSFGITGLRAEQLLLEANIVVNRNMVPNEEERPFITSGIRIGFPTITTQGYASQDIIRLAVEIENILKNDDLDYSATKAKTIVKSIHIGATNE